MADRPAHGLGAAWPVLLPTVVVAGAAAVYVWWGWGLAQAVTLAVLAVAAAIGWWCLGSSARSGGRALSSVAAASCAALAVLGAGTALDARSRLAAQDLIDAGRTRIQLTLTASPSEVGDVMMGSARVGAGRGSGAKVLAVVPLAMVEKREDWDRGTTVAGWFAVDRAEQRGPEAARARLVAQPVKAPLRAHDVLSSQRRALTGLYRGKGADTGAALVPGMVAGDRSLQSVRLTDAMTKAGLSHVTAVSGSNISVLICAMAAAGRALRLPTWLRASVSVCAVACFVLLVGPDPPVLRAAVMGALASIAVMTGKPRVGTLLVAVAATLLICADPWQLTRVAFRLSILACLGITLLGPALTRGLQHLRVPRMFAESVSVSVAATLACTPELIGLSSQQSTLIVPVNVAAAPFVVLVGTLGPLLLLVAPLGPVLSFPLVSACRLGADVVAWLGLTCAEHGPQVSWPDPPRGVVLAVLLCWIAPALLLRFLQRRGGRTSQTPGFKERWWQPVGRLFRSRHRDRPQESGRGHPKTRLLHILPLAITLVIAAGLGAVLTAVPPVAAVIGGSPRAGEAAPGDVLLCDVGQGDAIVLVAAGGRGVLLDAGPPDGDVGACLGTAGVSRLCAAMVSHLDNDHVGGLRQALARAPARSVFYGTAGRPAPVAGAQRPHDGQGVSCAPWSVEVVSAPRATEENDASLVIRARSDVGGGLDLLSAGDAEEDAARAAVQRGAARPSGERTRVLKISHHGSANGGTELMTGFMPDAALIGVGAHNSYGHPSPRITSALSAQRIPVLRTDRDGTVLLRSTTRGLRVTRHE